MFSAADTSYLSRLIGRNEVMLVLGAGFSREASNKLGEPFPTGYALGSKIWEFLGYPGDYDGTSLAEMFQAFIQAGKKRSLKESFLEENLLAGSVPAFYNALPIPYWYKIYQLNIDDVVDQIYGANSKNVQNLKYPKDEYQDRDQSLEKTQVVYLHGKLPCNPDELIFSTKQYAKNQLAHEPLYARFVYDYAVKPTIFVGTELNEQIFERYVEAREGKFGYAEHRPKSFLITPTISRVRADNLRDIYNVHHVSGTIKSFLEWIGSIASSLPTRTEILRTTFPQYLDLTTLSKLTNLSKSQLSDFAAGFRRVPGDGIVSPQYRSAYLLGASPTWQDIYKNLDVPRTVTNVVLEMVNTDFANSGNNKLKAITLMGTAGSGKSTILKRLGLLLSQSGKTTFLSYSEYLPKVEVITKVLESLGERAVVIFDNAKNTSSILKVLIEKLIKLKQPPLLVMAIRNNQFDKIHNYLDPDLIEHINFDIPDLDDREINALINVLDLNNLLGVLKGLSYTERFRHFKMRSRKQILIAMKEATNGRSFDEIIKDEFAEIRPDEAQVLCLCVALISELGFTTSKQDFVGFAKCSHQEALDFLTDALSGTIQWTDHGNRFMIRHRVLAEFMINQCASLESLKDAYIRVLSVLAPQMNNSQTHSRKFSLYKSLVSHKTLYFRFKENIEMAREVYESIADFFHQDAHFWLQYGSLEIEGIGGNLELAENYLNQAASINPTYYFIKNARCSLYFRLSVNQDNYEAALTYKARAEEIVAELLYKDQVDDPHTYHIQCHGDYYFIQRWIKNITEKRSRMKVLKAQSERAFLKYPRDRKLQEVMTDINRAYLLLGIDDPDVSFPQIT